MTEANTKTVSLVISERFALLKPQGGLLNDYKGTTEGLAFVLEDAKKISISKEEWDAAKLVETPIVVDGKEGGKSLAWEDKDSEKEIEISSSTVAYILAVIKAKDAAGEITLADHALITLKAKLQ